MQSTINEKHLADRAVRLGFLIYHTGPHVRHPRRILIDHQNEAVIGNTFDASLECIEAYLDRLES
jgi:hypothetical protein